MIPRIKQWLNDRTITDEVLVRYGIGWNGRQIVIPVHDEKGNFIFNKYRRDPETQLGDKYLYDKGSHSTLYGVHQVDRSKPIVITEGELDTLTLVSHGYRAISSTGGCKSFKAGWSGWFEGVETYICLDSDSPGREGAFKIHSLIPHSKIIFLPFGKDITEFFVQGGTSGEFEKLVAGAVSYPRADKKHFDFSQIGPRKEWGSDLERAKSVPITDFVKFEQGNRACCIWHKEKTPSMVYYPKQNRVFCFGCNQGGDTVDVFCQLNNVKMGEAIKNLIK